MGHINTVLGPISCEQLGTTLMHEHFLFGYPGWEVDTTVTFNKPEALKQCLNALEAVKIYGVKTIVDATPNELGRNVDFLKELSEKSGINIICTTGFFTDIGGASSYLKYRSSRLGRSTVVNEVLDVMVTEIQQGIKGTGVRAGVIKIATSQKDITEYEQDIFRAAARAQKETGIPIITHTGEIGGPEQVALLIAEGADPKRVMIGHCCASSDIQYHLAILKNGVYIGFDQFGINLIQSDDIRMGCMIGLIGIGYESKIMMSQDNLISRLGRPFEYPEELAPLFASWSLTHIFKDIIPSLKKAGIRAEQIDTVIEKNPREFFAGGDECAE